MDKIYYFLVVSAILSRSFALPARGLVYSAIIQNNVHHSVHCYVVWSNPDEKDFKSELYTVHKGKPVKIPRMMIKTRPWQTDEVVIYQVHCGQHELVFPFDGVWKPVDDWIFRYETDGLHSGSS